jgi:serine/threonine-protein kinase
VPTVQSRTRPKKLGSFEVLEEIGQGGMGVVYLARQPDLDRPVVVKKMRRGLTVDPSAVERFQREARAAAAVHHQNVVAVYDCFSMRGDHYIAEEYVDGPDLRSVLDEAKRLEPRIAALIGLEIVRGLEEIHARGIVHRDLKPDNILIGTGGETKIADFGIALDGKGYGLTRPGMMMGSIPYFSPEQMLGERMDYRSDLFVFGILLYEMITGVPPFEPSEEGAKDTLLERMQGGRYVPPRRRANRVPRYLARVIRNCLQPKTSRRIGTATAVRRQLERGLGRTSPADCRLQIATWLWERGLIQPAAGKTELRPLAAKRERGFGAALHRPLARWLAPVVITSVLIGVAVTANALGVFSRPPQSDPPLAAVRGDVRSSKASIAPVRTDPATVDGVTAAAADPVAVVADPALVRFVAWPWAEVRIEGRDGFVTPRAEPVSLPPGTYQVVFEHPTFGRADYTLELVAGEQRLIRHIYEQAPPP